MSWSGPPGRNGLPGKPFAPASKVSVAISSLVGSPRAFWRWSNMSLRMDPCVSSSKSVTLHRESTCQETKRAYSFRIHGSTSPTKRVVARSTSDPVFISGLEKQHHGGTHAKLHSLLQHPPFPSWVGHARQRNSGRQELHSRTCMHSGRIKETLRGYPRSSASEGVPQTPASKE